MHISELFEARKNPEQNPKVSINQHLNAAYEKYGDDAFVSFTKLDKLGVNPKSPYDTPIGIYAYPLGYVVRRMGDDYSAQGAVPFAGDAPYVNVFLAQGNVINFDDVGSAQISEYVKKIKSLFPVANTFTTSILDAKKFWYFTHRVAQEIADETGKQKPVVWNALMRQIGIDGFKDSGDGIIHQNEPTQAVFFHIGAIKMVDRIQNKYSPVRVSQTKEIGEARDAVARFVRDNIDAVKSIDDPDSLRSFFLIVQDALGRKDMYETARDVLLAAFRHMTPQGQKVVADKWYRHIPAISNVPIELLSLASIRGSYDRDFWLDVINSKYSERTVWQALKNVQEAAPSYAKDIARTILELIDDDYTEDEVKTKYSQQFVSWLRSLIAKQD